MPARRTGLGVYLARMRGQPGARKPKTVVRDPAALVVTLCASVTAMFAISVPALYLGVPLSTKLFLVGSFGASGTLLYGAPHAEFAQPKSMVLGQLIAAVVGVTAYKLVGGNLGVAGGLAVGVTTVVMQVGGCIHPPAGATALIAVLGPTQVHRLGYLYVATPILASTLVILVVGLVLLNLTPDESRHYPVTWW